MRTKKLFSRMLRILQQKNPGRSLLAALSLLGLLGGLGTGLFWYLKSTPKEGMRQIAPGLEYGDFLVQGNTHAYVFRANIKQWKPIIADARKGSRLLATAPELAKESGSMVLVNGSFFDTNDQPLGLLISEYKRYNPLRTNVDWGVFLVKNGTLSLVHTKEFQDSPEIEFAVQCGPRILINGKVPSLKPQSYTRTAIGITKNNELLIVVTYGGSIYADVLGHWFQEKLHATDALLLDGGTSTQLYASIGDFFLERVGVAAVSNGVGLKMINVPSKNIQQ